MPRTALPAKLVVVLVLLSLSLALDLYNITADAHGVANYVRIGLNIGLLVGLLRGQEWARMLAKVTAVLSLVAGTLLLVPLVMVGDAMFEVPGLAILAYATVFLTIVYGAFLLWCMNQPDVQAWLMSRHVGE